MPKVENPTDFVWDLYKRYNVITYLGEWFGAPDRVRLSYALDVEKIEIGLDRIGQHLKSRCGITAWAVGWNRLPTAAIAQAEFGQIKP